MEAQNFEIRRTSSKYDGALPRTVIYAERQSPRGRRPAQIRLVDDVVEGYVAAATGEGFPEEWDLDQALDRAQTSTRCR